MSDPLKTWQQAVKKYEDGVKKYLDAAKKNKLTPKVNDDIDTAPIKGAIEKVIAIRYDSKNPPKEFKKILTQFKDTMDELQKSFLSWEDDTRKEYENEKKKMFSNQSKEWDKQKDHLLKNWATTDGYKDTKGHSLKIMARFLALYKDMVDGNDKALDSELRDMKEKYDQLRINKRKDVFKQLEKEYENLVDDHDYELKMFRSKKNSIMREVNDVLRDKEYSKLYMTAAKCLSDGLSDLDEELEQWPQTNWDPFLIVK